MLQEKLLLHSINCFLVLREAYSAIWRRSTSLAKPDPIMYLNGGWWHMYAALAWAVAIVSAPIKLLCFLDWHILGISYNKIIFSVRIVISSVVQRLGYTANPVFFLIKFFHLFLNNKKFTWICFILKNKTHEICILLYHHVSPHGSLFCI